MKRGTTTLLALRSRDPARRRDLRHWLASNFDTALGAQSVLVAEADNSLGLGNPPFDALLDLGTADGEQALRHPELEQLDLVLFETAPVEFRNRIAHTPGAETPGVALVAFWVAKAELPDAEVLRHWREHAPLALEIHHGALRYVQAPICASNGSPKPYRGIALLQFAAIETLPADLYREPGDIALIEADVAEFIQETDVMVARQYRCRPSEARQ